jgi:hypothetical protein
MAKYDITMTNVAVRRLLEKTTNPRHRFLLMAYDRHRNLEMAGRYEEIFASEMMAEKPVYHFPRQQDEGAARRAGGGEKPVPDVDRD